jgi:hypothetical protein
MSIAGSQNIDISNTDSKSIEMSQNTDISKTGKQSIEILKTGSQYIELVKNGSQTIMNTKDKLQSDEDQSSFHGKTNISCEVDVSTKLVGKGEMHSETNEKQCWVKFSSAEEEEKKIQSE